MANEELTPEEKSAMELAKAMYTSILEAVIPQELMEKVGKSIVAETPWPKLEGREKVALFRVASILHDKLPKFPVPTGAGKGLDSRVEAEPTTDDPPSAETGADTPLVTESKRKK